MAERLGCPTDTDSNGNRSPPSRHDWRLSSRQSEIHTLPRTRPRKAQPRGSKQPGPSWPSSTYQQLPPHSACWQRGSEMATPTARTATAGARLCQWPDGSPTSVTLGTPASLSALPSHLPSPHLGHLCRCVLSLAPGGTGCSSVPTGTLVSDLQAPV